MNNREAFHSVHISINSISFIFQLSAQIQSYMCTEKIQDIIIKMRVCWWNESDWRTPKYSEKPFATLFTTDLIRVDRDSSVGIATRYGLDGPGIESRWGRDFPHPPRPARWPTQPPIQWVLGLSRG
jgi:hypothetical protein